MRQAALFLIIFFSAVGLFAVEFIKPKVEWGRIVFSLRFKPGEVRSAGIAGIFNRWSTGSAPLRYNIFSGAWEARLRLPDGRYEYKYILDGRWALDSANPLSTPDAFSGANSVVYIKNGRLDWTHDDRYIVWENSGLERPDALYIPELRGYYRLKSMEISLGTMSLVLGPGLVRLIDTKIGTTGFSYSGQVMVITNGITNSGTLLMARLSPRDFKEKVAPLLETVRESDDFIACNNMVELRLNRFYHNNRLLFIPPAGTYAFSLDNRFFTDERIFFADKGLHAAGGVTLDRLSRNSSTGAALLYSEKDKSRYPLLPVLLDAVIRRDVQKSTELSDPDVDLRPLTLFSVYSGFRYYPERIIYRAIEPSGSFTEETGIMEAVIMSVPFSSARIHQGRLEMIMVRRTDGWKVARYAVQY